MRSPITSLALSGAVILGMTAATAQVQGDRPTVDHQVPGATVSGQDAQRGAAPQDTTAPRTGTGPGIGQRYDATWDRHEWENVETDTYYGYFVDLFAFVSGAVDPRDEDQRQEARAPQPAGMADMQLIAFVEDRAALTEMLVDTGYLAVFPQDAEPLRGQMADMKGQRLRVTGQKFEHDGINLLRVMSAELAGEDEGRILGRADTTRERDHRVIEDQPGFEQRETGLPATAAPGDARTGAEVEIETRDPQDARS